MQRCFIHPFSAAPIALALAFASLACGEHRDDIVAPPLVLPIEADIASVDVVYATRFGLFTSKGNRSSRELLAEGDFRLMAVSHDGKRLAYTRNSFLYVSDITGKDETQITHSVTGRPAWSYDGGRLAFARDGAIYTADLTSGELARVTNPPEESGDVHPSWSPDGKRIAFSRLGDMDIQKIWTVGADGTNPIDISAAAGEGIQYPSWSPVWSPDGKKIAFASPGLPGVRIRNADGSGVIELPIANLSGYVSVDDWSPDGKWIVVKATRTDGRIDAYLLSLDGRYARVNDSESWDAVVVRTPWVAPYPLSPLNGRVYEGPASLYSRDFPSITGSRYIIADDGRFVFRLTYSYGQVRDYPGTIRPEGSGFRLYFEGDSRWEATATIDGAKLTIRYNLIMLMTDFIDGTYTLVS